MGLCFLSRLKGEILSFASSSSWLFQVYLGFWNHHFNLYLHCLCLLLFCLWNTFCVSLILILLSGFMAYLDNPRVSLVAQLVKNRLQCRRPGFDPWIGKIPWRRERLLTLISWPWEFHGLYKPWGCKESDTTEWLSLHSLDNPIGSPHLKVSNLNISASDFLFFFFFQIRWYYQIPGIRIQNTSLRGQILFWLFKNVSFYMQSNEKYSI